MFFSLNCGEFWTKKKDYIKQHNNLLKEKKIPWKHTFNLDIGILPMKKYIMGGNYQEKCFLGWDHLMHCNKKLVRNGQMFFSCTLKKQQQINKPMSIWDTLYLQKQTILTILQHDIILWMMKNSFYYIDSVSYICTGCPRWIWRPILY